MSHRVALIKQADYEPKSLASSIRRAIEHSGFDLGKVRGARVLLKPNMLGAYPPSMGITTHPSFVAAAGRIFKEAGASVSVGDSPNGVHSIGRTWEETGIRAACEEAGLDEARFEAAGSVDKNGVMISRAAAEADVLVNLPKFKTHGLTILTLAVKNLFGCVCGMQKSAVHRLHPDWKDFAFAIVRVADAVRPALNIVDGVVAMEGNGPSSGRLTGLGCVMAGTDMHSVDAAGCRLVGLMPRHLDTLAAAEKLGLWNPLAEIEMAGDPFEELRPANFLLPSTYTRGMRDWWISRLALRLIWSGSTAQPSVIESTCRRCGLCVDACPVKAIDRRASDSAAIIDEGSCIQCMCCHEICPYRAIELRQGLALKIISWLSSRSTKSTGQ